MTRCSLLLLALLLAGCARGHQATRSGPPDGCVACQQDALADSGPLEGGALESGTADAGCGSQSCLVDGVCYPSGTADPQDACHVCDPGFSRTGWAPAPGCVITLAGTGTAGFADGPAALAQFSTPEEIALTPDGSVYVADSYNHRVRLIQGGQVSTVAGSGAMGLSDGPALQATFNRPHGIAVGASGEIYIVDLDNDVLRLIQGGQVSTLAGDGVAGYVDGPVASARFSHPYSVALGDQGELYVTDSANERVRAIQGGQVTTLAGSGTEGFLDGPVSSAQFDRPYGIAVSSGSVLVTDRQNHAVRVITAGQVTTLTGGVEGYLDGDLSAARLSMPEGICAAGSTVYVADYGNSSIRVISAGKVSTLAGDGVAGHVDGPLHQARFAEPTGVQVDGAGRIYVSDSGNHCIRVLAPAP